MSETRTYTVTGMTCVASVIDEVTEFSGIDADVDLDSRALTVTNSGTVDDAAVKAAVEEADYQLA